MSTSSKKITVTLPALQYEELEQIALDRGVTVPRIILERLNQWQPAASSSPAIDLTVWDQRFGQLTEQIKVFGQALADRPTPPSVTDTQIRTLLQPILNRLQQLEAQIGAIGHLLQQSRERMRKDQARSELWLEAIFVVVQPMLLDGQPEEIQIYRQGLTDELNERLVKHLAEHE